jgi:hypothetical protein
VVESFANGVYYMHKVHKVFDVIHTYFLET